MKGHIERLDSRWLLTTTLMRERTFAGGGVESQDVLDSIEGEFVPPT